MVALDRYTSKAQEDKSAKKNKIKEAILFPHSFRRSTEVEILVITKHLFTPSWLIAQQVATFIRKLVQAFLSRNNS